MEYQKIDDLRKFIIRVGTVLSAEKIEGSEKLLKLMIDFGDEQRQILSGIAKYFQPEELIGKQLPVVINLEPRKMMGLESQGMILCAGNEENLALLHPSKSLPNGSHVS
ncbi:MAG: methionine--tRNA ligase subunit beta [Niabella sp.]|nr:MAG: methionine--tRNA ligase subunit beta [Niabella sp.]